MTLDDLKLVVPNRRYRGSFLRGLREFKTDAERQDWNYLGRKEPANSPLRDFDDFVERLLATEHTPQPTFVTNTTYWAYFEKQVVGRIGIRHELNEFLERIGGHIGYIVRPSFRGRGIAQKMLELTLQTKEAKKIGRLLLTCDEGHIGSEKVITKNGGILENIIENAPHPRKKRYWIDLNNPAS